VIDRAVIHTTRIMRRASRLDRRFLEYVSGCVTARYLRNIKQKRRWKRGNYKSRANKRNGNGQRNAGKKQKPSGHIVRKAADGFLARPKGTHNASGRRCLSWLRFRSMAPWLSWISSTREPQHKTWKCH